jgi:hypothetical protein
VASKIGKSLLLLLVVVAVASCGGGSSLTSGKTVASGKVRDTTYRVWVHGGNLICVNYANLGDLNDNQTACQPWGASGPLNPAVGLGEQIIVGVVSQEARSVNVLGPDARVLAHVQTLPGAPGSSARYFVLRTPTIEAVGAYSLDGAAGNPLGFAYPCSQSAVGAPGACS